ncbi:MAG: ISL3 family transposase [Solobacterium sp.]|nr:ISL3 family transposase [Solobacterium sp.]
MTDESQNSIYVGSEKLLGFDGIKITGHKEEYTAKGESVLTLFAEPAETRRPICPVCQQYGAHSLGFTTRHIIDLPVGEHDVTYIDVKVRRYKCQNPKCGKAYQDSLKTFVEDGSNISRRMKERIARQSAVHGFQTAAMANGITNATAKLVFDEWSEKMDDLKKGLLIAPEILGIDEAHIGPRAKDMRGVFIDVVNGKLIEITPNRESETVKATIASMKNWERIKAITIDMYAQYRSDIYDMYGPYRTLVVVDHFHVIQDLNKKMMKARKLIVEAAGNPPVGDNHHLMMCNLEDLSKDQRTELYWSFKTVPELQTLYLLKESFRSIYCAEDRKKAEAYFELWVSQIPEPLPAPVAELPRDENGKVISKRGRKKKYVDRFDPIRVFANTVRQWHKEIFNWFDLKVSNATTEAVNRLVKEVNLYGRGYSFETFRHRVLYGLTGNYLPTEKIYISKTHTNMYGEPWKIHEYHLRDYDPEKLAKEYDIVIVRRRYWCGDFEPDIRLLADLLEKQGSRFMEAWEDVEET